MKRFFVMLSIVLAFSVAYAQDEPKQPAIIILNVDGTITYARSGWQSDQALDVGTLVGVDDFVYPEDATVVAMCPDGTTMTFAPGVLLPNDVIRCPITDPKEWVVGQQGLQRFNIQRGGRQDPTIPYLISPRATLVRTNHVRLNWNAPSDAEYFTVVVRQGSEQVWKSDRLKLGDVAQDDIASIDVPVELKAKAAYTVEICVLFTDLEKGCTTDPGWSTGVNVAFYYEPNDQLDKLVDDLASELKSDPAASLYSRAIILCQAEIQVSTDTQLGYYQEAISLIEALMTDYPDSAFAGSPELYNQLGALYQKVNLPLSATRAYAQALKLAKPGTEASAVAALGNGFTTPNGDLAVDFFNRALDDYAGYLAKDTFDNQFKQVCSLIGDICLDLKRCQDRLKDCTKWYRTKP
jgi:tetratricopeptide (TPR) repeat protein